MNALEGCHCPVRLSQVCMNAMSTASRCAYLLLTSMAGAPGRGATWVAGSRLIPS